MRFVVVAGLLLIGAMLLSALPLVASAGQSEASPAADTDPPHLVAFDFEPKTVNTALSGQVVTFTVHLTDDLSGVADHKGPTQARFRSPSNSQFSDVTFRPMYDLVSGNAQDGVYVNDAVLPRYSEAGIWHVEYFLLYDEVGNHRTLHQDDMMAMGFPTELLVEDALDDTAPPSLAGFDFEPKVINTAISGQVVTFMAHITDDLSGVADHTGPTQVRFHSPSDSQLVDAVFRPSDNLVSGDAWDGVYVDTAIFPRYCETGLWHVEYFALYDEVGNSAHLHQDDLAALGFPTELMVTDEVHAAFLPAVMRANP